MADDDIFASGCVGLDCAHDDAIGNYVNRHADDGADIDAKMAAVILDIVQSITSHVWHNVGELCAEEIHIGWIILLECARII